jgi:hypothetical protein
LATPRCNTTFSFAIAAAVLSCADAMPAASSAASNNIVLVIVIQRPSIVGLNCAQYRLPRSIMSYLARSQARTASTGSW